MGTHRVLLVSYGASWLGPEDGYDYQVDVRQFGNPHHNPKLRSLRGTDAPVQREVLAHKPFRDLVDLVARGIGPGMRIGVYCQRGRHRSVAFVEAVARRLRRRGLAVTVYHRDKDK